MIAYYTSFSWTFIARLHFGQYGYILFYQFHKTFFTRLFYYLYTINQVEKIVPLTEISFYFNLQIYVENTISTARIYMEHLFCKTKTLKKYNN
jgi:hypothetical protein